MREVQGAAASSHTDAISYISEEYQHGKEEQAVAAGSGAGSGCRQVSVRLGHSTPDGQGAKCEKAEQWQLGPGAGCGACEEEQSSSATG